MRLIRGLGHLQAQQDGCVLTIGNFDGVHLGHRTVLEKLAEQGRFFGLPVFVMVFEPQPLEFFLGDNAPSRLTRLREKVIQMAKLPVDGFVIMHFNRRFADSDPERFVREVLVDKLRVRHLAVGDDFHFGKARRGNFALLQKMGGELGFSVESTTSFLIDDQRVSSTLIRDALGNGDLQQAAMFLGRPYSVCGRVVHGEKRGRALGFPTANIQMLRRNTPIEGVFAVTMTGIDDCEIPGVANVGTRPTVSGDVDVLLETFLLDFNRDIYGRYVEVHFQHKIRDEMRFHSLEALRRQIADDVAAARRFFADDRITQQ
ncbi:MAG: bifunctional riboflavin kinase/FAD synthetase [Gammaproteobacteria bacterium]